MINISSQKYNKTMRLLFLLVISTEIKSLIILSAYSKWARKLAFIFIIVYISIGTVFGNAIKIYLDTFYTQKFHFPRAFTLTLLVKVKNWKHSNSSLVVNAQ